MTMAFNTRSQRLSAEMALSTIAEFCFTSLGSLMPGVMLCVWMTGPIASVTAVEASLRVSFSKPGLRFCGMALDT
ncbi:hypothetical protein D3C73_595640 [compost metagenome]